MDDQHNNQDYRDSINKAVDAFCAMSHNNQAMFLENQKLIIREIMHERRDIERETLQNHKQETKYQRWHTTIGTIVILGSLIAGLYVGVQQMNLSRLYKREGWLETRINIRDAQYNALMSAMTTVRGIRVEGQTHCKNWEYVGPDPAGYQQRLLGADYKLLGATFGPKRIFDDEIRKRIVSFLSAVRPSQKICDKHSATDHDLEINQDKLSNLIVSSINELEMQKHGIEDRIAGIEDESENNSKIKYSLREILIANHKISYHQKT